MNNSLKTAETAARLLSWAAIFLLPWQARWIVEERLINGTPYEYGAISVYVTMVIVVLACAARAAIFFRMHGGAKHAFRECANIPAYRRICIGAAVFAVWVIVSVVRADDQVLALWFAVTALCSFAYYFVARGLGRHEAVRALIASGAAQAAFAWVFFIFQSVPASTVLGVAAHVPEVLGQSVVMLFGTRLLRAYGTLPHPNVLGGFMALASVAAAYEFIHNSSPRQNWPRYFFNSMAVVLLLFSVVLISFSRSALLALVAAALVWFIIHARSLTRGEILRGFKVLFSCVILFAVFNAIAGNAWLGRFSAALNTSAGNSLETRSVEERIVRYHEARVVFGSSGMVIGTGLGNYVAALSRAFPSLPAYAYQPVHNAYVMAVIELGVVGMGFVIVLAWLFARMKFLTNSLYRNGLFIAPLTVLAVVSLFDHYTWTLYVGQALVWCALGILYKTKTPAGRI